MELTLEVLGQERIAQRLDNLTPRMRQALRIGMAKATTLLQGHVKMNKLSGDPLHRRTGTLSRSINAQVTEDADGVIGRVGTNVEYAAVHEFGGTFTIKAHMATMTQVWGRKLENPIQVFVREHMAVYPKRSFLRSAYEEKKDTIKDEMKLAVAQGVRA